MSTWKNLCKRGFAVFLSLTLCLSLMNVSAFAAETEDTGSDDSSISDTQNESDTSTESGEDEDGASESGEDEDDASESAEGENDETQTPDEGEDEAGEPVEGENGETQTPDEGEDEANKPVEGENGETQTPAEGEDDANKPVEGENGETQTPDEGEDDANKPVEGENGETQTPDEGEGDANKPVEGENGETQTPDEEETSGALGEFLSKIEAIGSGELDMDGILSAIDDCLSSYEQLSEEEKAALAEARDALLTYQGELTGVLPDPIAPQLPELPEVPQAPQYSDAVQAFLDAAAQLPEEVTEENVEEVGAALEALLPLYQSLSEEEQNLDVVVSAYIRVMAVYEQYTGVNAQLMDLTWSYTVEPAVETNMTSIPTYENISDITDADIRDLFANAKIPGAAPWGVYDNETYTIPTAGSMGLEARMKSCEISASLTAPGTHKLYVTDYAAQHFTPQWDLELNESGEPILVDGSPVLNGIKIQGVKGGSTVFYLMYAYYPLNSEDATVVFKWKLYIGANPEETTPSNAVPEAPDADENYFWYGTAKPNYERVWTKETSGGSHNAVSMVMVPMRGNSYEFSPDNTTWTADGNHNYDVVYCAEMDVETSLNGEKYRIGKVIEESRFDEETQNKLRAIIENGYPFLSADEMNQRMGGTNYDTAVLTAATQHAVWAITDGVKGDVTKMFTELRVPITFINTNHLYIPNSIKYELLSPENTLHTETKRYKEVVSSKDQEEVEAAIAAVNSVVDYLLNCKASELQKEFKITEAAETFIRNADGTYNLTVTGTLSREALAVDGETETVSVTLTSGDQSATGTVEGTSFTVTLKNVAAGATVTLNAAATLRDRMQVFYYTSESGQYQNFIGGKVARSAEEDFRSFKAPTESKLTITKEWSDGNGNHAADEVKVEVLNKDGEVVKTVNLNSENGWKAEVVIPDSDLSGYSVQEVDVKEGYTASVGLISKVEGTENEWTVTVSNIFTPPPAPAKGNLLIIKQVNGGGSEAKNKTYTFTVTGPNGFSQTVTITGEGSSLLEDLEPGEYTVTEDRDGAVISGYTLTISGSGSSAAVVAGGTENVTVTNTYTTPGGGDPGDPEDPEDPEDPTTPPPTPEIPDEEVPLTDIPEEDVPLTEIPEEPEELEIPEENVPLAEVPETGDLSGNWMMAMFMGALGMIWMALTGKKRSEEEG